MKIYILSIEWGGFQHHDKNFRHLKIGGVGRGDFSTDLICNQTIC